MTNNALENEKRSAAAEAVKFLEDDQIVGLGTGSSATYAIEEVAKLVKNGLKIKAVPTSFATEELAKRLGITIIDINSIDRIDITIDGADEFTEDLALIKGGGGALLREKIVASMTEKEIIITDSTKRVEFLGSFKLPVEIIPFATSHVMKKIRSLGGAAKLRMKDRSYYLTDSKNYILDVDFGLIHSPAELADNLDRVTGIVEHGLFINLAYKVIMGSGGDVTTYSKDNQSIA